MGLNAQTAVPAFVSGEILTAAEMTQVNTGIPVFATTVTRDAAFGGTGEKVLAQGQYAYIEATSSLMVYSGSAWQTVNASALVRVGGGSLSGSTVTFSNVFSATYDNYLISLSNVTSTGNAFTTMRLGTTATGYYNSFLGNAYTNSAQFDSVCYMGTSGGAGTVNIGNPFLAKFTVMSAFIPNLPTASNSSYTGGFLNNTTSYTDFSLSGGSFTAGTVNIYGYTLS